MTSDTHCTVCWMLAYHSIIFQCSSGISMYVLQPGSSPTLHTVQPLNVVLQAAAAKAGLMCLGQVLAAVEPGAWPAAAPGFQLLLSFLTDARPKVRQTDSWRSSRLSHMGLKWHVIARCPLCVQRHTQHQLLSAWSNARQPTNASCPAHAWQFSMCSIKFNCLPQQCCTHTPLYVTCSRQDYAPQLQLIPAARFTKATHPPTMQCVHASCGCCAGAQAGAEQRQ